jgi:putative transposase
MPRKGRSNEEIVHALGQVEAGEKVTEVCRPLGVSEQTVYRWKKQFAGLGVQELRELRSLRDENRKLKQVVKSSGTASPGPRTSSVDVPAEYRSLHKYLDGRYADTVVLRFAEIEDLLGFALPDGARLRQDWWANADADGQPSTQSQSWLHASRPPTPTCWRRPSSSSAKVR